ncbi:alpha-L-glutamate ligase-like protein [Persicirhabdus sediminis]|uniref:Alpha-L-glutamate ligase-like protein n=1 Tax=Persicirhabdus sediminis TaxID=454144 RepID=A0A8J7MFW1_9BACT|nr:alpha-L-glutamate ligase-like protein [Persicirhabdus sediminis]MBK1791413.1 alpha-L-glutamate ligase-like protein [Persicirhabdus sediminis]
MFRLTTPSKLRKRGIIGMNHRNVVCIAQNNPRKLYPMVDNKLITKKLCKEAGIAAPKLIGTVKTQSNVRELEEFLKDDQAFVIKPAKGSGGKGILVITGRDGKNFLKPSGAVVTPADIRNHASSTISGLFSLGGAHDVAMIEELVEFDNAFDGFSYQGVPDIRIILYHGYPVMAMTRLSTKDSDGKANLHQGAVGLGIDITTGKALRAVQHGQMITHHPDTGKDLNTFAVPQWLDFITLASQCYDMTGLGYLGADVVLDAKKGPLILELNARPGLAIQMANGMGMKTRFDLVEKQLDTERNFQERVEFSMKHFGQ